MGFNSSSNHATILGYDIGQYFITQKDPIVDTWFMLESPYPMISLVVVYLLFVLKVGPEWMENRKPFQLTTIVVGYNAVQVLYSLWLITACPGFGLNNLLTAAFDGCNFKISPELALQIATGGWYYFMAKVSELLDTVFFILRKKNSQVTGLHVYHHATMVLFTWCYMKYCPAEQGIMISMLNTSVHVVMYFYYMVAALGPNYRKYLWWKKYLTKFQLVQFSLLITYFATLTIKGCTPPIGINILFIINTSLFFFLFFMFYQKSYVNNSKKIK